MISRPQHFEISLNPLWYWDHSKIKNFIQYFSITHKEASRNIEFYEMLKNKGLLIYLKGSISDINQANSVFENEISKRKFKPVKRDGHNRAA